MNPSLAPSFVWGSDVGSGAGSGSGGGKGGDVHLAVQPSGRHLCGLLYGLVYAGMRLAISHNLPHTSNVLAQTLEPGYVLRQPPLYEWMLWSVQRVTGPTLPSFLVLKYGLSRGEAALRTAAPASA